MNRPKADVDRDRQALYQELDQPMTIVDFYRKVLPLIESLADPHTSYSHPVIYTNQLPAMKRFSRFMWSLRVERHISLQIGLAIRIFHGAELLSIDGIPLSTIHKYIIANRSYYFTHKLVEGRETISTTGSISVPAEAAIGGVRFTNLTEEAVDIPLGTIISTLGANPVQFSTTRAGNMPAGPGKTTTLPVVALLPGAKGNLPAGSLRAVEGELGLSLAVTNPSAMHEGRDVYASGPAAGDYTRLYERLYTTLRQAAATELKANLEPGEFAIFP